MDAPPIMDGNTFAAIISTIYETIRNAVYLAGGSFVFTLAVAVFLLKRIDTLQQKIVELLIKIIPLEQSVRDGRRVAVDRITEALIPVNNPISPETAEDIMELHSLGLDEDGLNGYKRFGPQRALLLVQRLNKDLATNHVSDVERSNIAILLDKLHSYIGEHEAKEKITGEQATVKKWKFF